MRIEPSTARSKLKSNALTDCAMGGCGGVMYVCCEPEFFVEMAVFNPVAPFRYLLANMYLSVADIANPDFLGCYCRTCINLDIASFYEEQCQLL